MYRLHKSRKLEVTFNNHSRSFLRGINRGISVNIDHFNKEKEIEQGNRDKIINKGEYILPWCNECIGIPIKELPLTVLMGLIELYIGTNNDSNKKVKDECIKEIDNRLSIEKFGIMSKCNSNMIEEIKRMSICKLHEKLYFIRGMKSGSKWNEFDIYKEVYRRYLILKRNTGDMRGETILKEIESSYKEIENRVNDGLIIPFGRHKGKLVEELDRTYIHWLIKNLDNKKFKWLIDECKRVIK